MNKLSFLFWNSRHLEDHEILVELAIKHSLDVICLAESGFDPVSTTDALSMRTGKQFSMCPVTGKKLQLFACPNVGLKEVYGAVDNGRISVQEFTFSNEKHLLGIVHFPSKVNWSNSAADLWPSDLVPQELVTPFEIMSAQATALNSRMKGLVSAEVKSLAVDDNADPRLLLRFEIFSIPQTRRVKLFEAAHRLDFSYPVVLHGPGQLPPFLREKYYQPSFKDLIPSARISKVLQSEGKWVESDGTICATPQEFTLKLRELLASAEIKSAVMAMLKPHQSSEPT